MAKASIKSSAKAKNPASDAVTAEEFFRRMQQLQTKADLKQYHRFFKFDEADPEGDQFLGVRMGTVFALAKELMNMEPSEIEKLLESKFHDVRVGAVSIMDFQARSKATSDKRKEEIFKLYLRRHDRINDWDLVDRSAPYVVGMYLANRPRTILRKLAKSKSIWERRTAIVATGYFIRQNELDETFAIASLLVADREDFVHKATGWMLRASGDRDQKRLIRFLDNNLDKMAPVLVRYATEKLGKSLRKYYMDLRKQNG